MCDCEIKHSRNDGACMSCFKEGEKKNVCMHAGACAKATADLTCRASCGQGCWALARAAQREPHYLCPESLLALACLGSKLPCCCSF